jgi:hypothetical protein
LGFFFFAHENEFLKFKTDMSLLDFQSQRRTLFGVVRISSQRSFDVMLVANAPSMSCFNTGKCFEGIGIPLEFEASHCDFEDGGF